MSKGNKGHTSALYVWNGLSVFWGTSFHTDPHHHNTLQLVFDIEKEFKLKDEHANWTSYSTAIIEASHTHQLDSDGSIQLFIYLDKDSIHAKKLTQKYLSKSPISSLQQSGIRELSNDFFKKLLIATDCDVLYKGCHTILKHLIEIDVFPDRDLRVERALSFIIDNPDRRFKVKDIAQHVHLSESRLRHLFKEQVGQPIQNFILWMKVVSSLNLVLKGKQLIQTAYDSGFWDSSHMNRSYRELLGVAPGSIQKYVDDLKIISCTKSNFYTFRTEILKDWDSKQTVNIINT